MGSEMCIRDRFIDRLQFGVVVDALGNTGHAQGLGNTHVGAQQRRITRVVGQVPTEQAVNLDVVHAHVTQLADIADAVAHVLNTHRHVQPMGAFDQVLELRRVGKGSGLPDFNTELSGGGLVLLQKLLQPRCETGVADRRGGQVGAGILAGLDNIFLLPGSLPPGLSLCSGQDDAPRA